MFACNFILLCYFHSNSKRRILHHHRHPSLDPRFGGIHRFSHLICNGAAALFGSIETTTTAGRRFEYKYQKRRGHRPLFFVEWDMHPIINIKQLGYCFFKTKKKRTPSVASSLLAIFLPSILVRPRFFKLSPYRPFP